MGAKRHCTATRLLITADGGGSNSCRCRLWKVALQDLATWLDMPIHVCHFPPGTSKWNKIEHEWHFHAYLPFRYEFVAASRAARGLVGPRRMQAARSWARGRSIRE